MRNLKEQDLEALTQQMTCMKPCPKVLTSVIPCEKGHEKSFILYYYTYDISDVILDLDPDLYQ